MPLPNFSQRPQSAPKPQAKAPKPQAKATEKTAPKLSLSLPGLQVQRLQTLQAVNEQQQQPTAAKSLLQPARPAPTLSTQRDPADMLADVLRKAALYGNRAVEAMAAGQTDKMLNATLDMQGVINASREVLRQAFYAARSKRVPLETRRAVNAKLKEGMEPLADVVRQLSVRLKAAKARQDAITAALTAHATRPGSVYVARGYTVNGRAGAIRPAETVRHAIALTV